MKYLIEVLKDENEYARRAAVEVLNSLGTSKDIKHLLQVIKDDDWWVRTRAADALGKIGGPTRRRRRDRSHPRRGRRSAAGGDRDPESDEGRARRQCLIAATKDKDWWVSERAVDALAEIGSKKAVPTLLELLRLGNARSLPTVDTSARQAGRRARDRAHPEGARAPRKGNQGRGDRSPRAARGRQACRQHPQLYPFRRLRIDGRNHRARGPAGDRRYRQPLLEYRGCSTGQGRQDG